MSNSPKQKPSRNERTIKRLTNALILVIAIFIITTHHLGGKLDDYEARFVALSVKSSQLEPKLRTR